MATNHGPTTTRMYRERKVDFASYFQTRSPRMRQFLDDLALFVEGDRRLFLFGEPGSGKTFLAQAIHNASQRRKGQFIHLNAAETDSELLRSEWFGHKRGAFTGAQDDHEGQFVRADGGTLFLDEVLELSALDQARLLRAIEMREVQPVGGTEAVHVDCRFVFASNVPLDRVLSTPERWRPDFLSRLGLCWFHVPPLRERIEDLPDLAGRMVGDLCLRDGRERPPELPSHTLRALAERHWRANLRELRATLEAALPRCTGDALLPEHLPPPLGLLPSAPPWQGQPAGRKLRELEREAVQHAVTACGGNKREAARLLGISPDRLYRVLRTQGQA